MSVARELLKHALAGDSNMNKRFAYLALFLAGCTRPVLQGGSNTNDRTSGGQQGEVLLTGAMVVSPDGNFALAQRNATSVLVDVEGKTARELPEQVDRFVFAKSGNRAIAVLADRASVVAYELPSLTEVWRTTPSFASSTGPTLARLSDDGQYLVLGDSDNVLVLDATTGETRGQASIGSRPTELSFVPGGARALVVGSTAWSNHQPKTTVVDLELATQLSKSVDVPNCEAPVVVLPDASRAFLSPTFCQEGQASNGTTQWTNPDPVSVIDLGADGPAFVKNLPGFGPVAIDEQAHRAVAYLDVQRIDESMFDDKSKIPSKAGARYNIMTIDPKSLDYQVSEVGNVLPRFVMAKDGKSLLVDATVQQVRGEADVKATIDSNGNVIVQAKVFGTVDSLFGQFDLESGTYAPFSGPPASLDRFVQLADAIHVYTLKMTPDGLGGDLYRIDLDAKASVSLGRSLRDIGLLADGKTLVLRERLPAVKVQTSAGFDWYRHERYCFSLDGLTCTYEIEFQDSKPFQSGTACTDYHDC
jgi:hypothetical protein